MTNRVRVQLPPAGYVFKSNPAALGETELLLTASSTVRAIVVLAGLPFTLFGRVLAHEMAHGWLARWPGRRTPPEEEGICELVAAWWLAKRGGPFAAKLLRDMDANNDPVYGSGYRRCRTIMAGFLADEIVARIEQSDGRVFTS